MLKVKDVMVTQVVTVSPFATLRQALGLMRSHGVKSLVVERRGPHDAFGILQYSHLLSSLVADEGDIDLLNVYDLADMTTPTVHEELAVTHAARMMSRHELNRVVVIRDNQLTGLLTVNDIVRHLLHSLDD